MKENFRRLAQIFIGTMFILSCSPQGLGNYDSNSYDIHKERGVEEYSQESIISFMMGEVEIQPAGKDFWEWADIGISLEKGDRIRTGADGYCEIQLGEISLIRVEENTHFSIESIYSENDNRDIELSLEEGTLACKVNKLLNTDDFTVAVPTAACGIRGTQFLISYQKGENTTLAVQEGSVSFIPLLETQDHAPVSEDDILLVKPGEEITLDTVKYSEILEVVESASTEEILIEEIRGILNSEVEPISDESKNIMDGLEDEEIMAEILEENEIHYEQVRLSVQPINTNLTINGKIQQGDFSALLPRHSLLIIKAEAPGFFPLSEEWTIEEDQDAINVNLIQKKAQVYSIQSQSNVKLTEGDLFLGSGSAELQVLEEETHLIGFSAPGYNSQFRRLEFQSETAVDLQVNLSPTIDRIFTASTSKIVGIASYGNRIFCSDQDGALTAFDSSGSKEWFKATSNYPNPSTTPYATSQRIYFTGANTLDILSYDNQGLTAHVSRDLEKDELQFFGNSLSILGDKVLYPTSLGFSFLDRETGEVRQSVEIPEGSRMTPSVWNNRIYLVNQKGVVFQYNQNGDLLEQLDTSLDAPIAQRILFTNDQAYFADKMGNLCSFNPSSMTLNWTAQLTGENRAVSHDLQSDGDYIYTYTTGTLFRIRKNGRGLQLLAEGLSAPPYISNGFMYGGNLKGEIIIIDIPSNQVLFQSSLEEDEQISGNFGLYDSKVLLGTTAGRIVILNPQHPSMRIR